MAAPVRAFENPVLERLSRVHPAVPAIIWGPLALGLIVLGGVLGLVPATIAVLTVAGIAAWTLAEYVLHRWVFHWEPASPRLRRAIYPLHRLHHDAQEYDRLVAPPLLAVPIWSAFLTAFWLLLGTPTIFPFFGGFTLGYLGYDYIHFFTHFGTPRGRLGRGLRRRHLQHHFAWPDRWYGVSSPLWDHIFRTHVRRGDRPVRT